MTVEKISGNGKQTTRTETSTQKRNDVPTLIPATKPKDKK